MNPEDLWVSHEEEQQHLRKLLAQGEEVAARLLRTTGDIRAALAFLELLSLEVHWVSRVPTPTPGSPHGSKASE
jgi:hypothetical protein